MTRTVALLTLSLLTPVAFAADTPCPPGLMEAALAMRVTMQDEQEVIRASTLAQPEGVEETVQFDLGAHACHRGPGQAYRVFGEPTCRPVDAEGRIPVRYPYTLQYRKALTLDELFEKDWQPGSDGLQQVKFEAEGARWIPVARKELLIQLEKNRSSPSAHPAGSAHPK